MSSYELPSQYSEGHDESSHIKRMTLSLNQKGLRSSRDPKKADKSNTSALKESRNKKRNQPGRIVTLKPGLEQ